MLGTVAITDYDWYRRLQARADLDEVNFWKPPATRTFRAPECSPFLFKLRAPHNAVCGFGYFARYARLPDWLAWDTFGVGNGCESLREMRERISAIRERVKFRGPRSEIGCVLIVQPTFFPPDHWVPSPRDWPVRTQSEKKYDLSRGEGDRVWRECLAAASALRASRPSVSSAVQGTFRVGVIEAYRRACAITGEHSLPALEAAHIRSYTAEGPHRIANGILLRADFHRLLDQGYVTIMNDYRVLVGRRLREDYANGRSYYPYQGKRIDLPKVAVDWPAREYLEWHRERVRG